MASSLAEQIIPSEIWPYVWRAPISNPPGSTAPGRASATRSPTAKLTAPQMTPDASSAGASSCASETATRQYLSDQHATDVMPDGFDRFDLEPGGGQPPRNLGGVHRFGQGHVLAQPGKR